MPVAALVTGLATLVLGAVTVVPLAPFVPRYTGFPIVAEIAMSIFLYLIQLFIRIEHLGPIAPVALPVATVAVVIVPDFGGCFIVRTHANRRGQRSAIGHAQYRSHRR